MRYRDGNLITLAKEGHFNIITHGCNCFCTMGSGIAPQIAEAFPEAYDADQKTAKGDIRKLGGFTEADCFDERGEFVVTVINSYTQFGYDASTKPLDYEALALAMRKINYINKGNIIGLPRIGAGLAGGDWNRISEIIMNELNQMDIWIVNYKP
jgi:O-acetyl-ADP-ribose deacetylase (regulator of RNase III)